MYLRSMYVRKIGVRQLLRLYPAAWRKEYGEEMRSMLLAQPLTASVIGDVFLNALRQNLRQPDPWKVAALFLICWETLWIFVPLISPHSQTARALAIQNNAVFIWVAFFTGCRTVIKEGDVWRGGLAGCWATLTGELLPFASLVILLSLAPETLPRWAFAEAHHLPAFFAHTFIPRMLASWCGALLGYLQRKRFRKSIAGPNGRL